MDQFPEQPGKTKLSSPMEKTEILYIKPSEDTLRHLVRFPPEKGIREYFNTMYRIYGDEREEEESIDESVELISDLDPIIREIEERQARFNKAFNLKIHLRGINETKQVFLFGKEILPTESLKYHNHSPDGFNWGYGGSGPGQLALALCIEIMGVDKALGAYMDFKWNYIANLPQTDFDLTFEINIP